MPSVALLPDVDDCGRDDNHSKACFSPRCLSVSRFPADSPIPSGDNRGISTYIQSYRDIRETSLSREITNETQSTTETNCNPSTAIIQLTHENHWSRLAPRLSNISCDEEDRAILPIHTSSPQTDPETDELTSPTDSTQSSVYMFSPATWTPQESGGNT